MRTTPSNGPESFAVIETVDSWVFSPGRRFSSVTFSPAFSASSLSNFNKAALASSDVMIGMGWEAIQIMAGRSDSARSIQPQSEASSDFAAAMECSTAVRA